MLRVDSVLLLIGQYAVLSLRVAMPREVWILLVLVGAGRLLLAAEEVPREEATTCLAL